MIDSGDAYRADEFASIARRTISKPAKRERLSEHQTVILRYLADRTNAENIAEFRQLKHVRDATYKVLKDKEYLTPCEAWPYFEATDEGRAWVAQDDQERAEQAAKDAQSQQYVNDLLNRIRDSVAEAMATHPAYLAAAHRGLAEDVKLLDDIVRGGGAMPSSWKR